MYVRFIWFNVWFQYNISMVIFCLDDLSITESLLVLLYFSNFLFMSASVCLIYLVLQCQMYRYLWLLYILNELTPLSHYYFWLKGDFVLCKYSYSHFFCFHFHGTSFLISSLLVCGCHQIYVCLFLIYVVMGCFFIGKFNPFTFKVFLYI